MFNFENAGEVLKRTPEADDVKGICSTYPGSSSPGEGGSGGDGDGGPQTGGLTTVTVGGDLDRGVPPRMPGFDGPGAAGCAVVSAAPSGSPAGGALLAMLLLGAGLGPARRRGRP
jgi:hypothetical protein